MKKLAIFIVILVVACFVFAQPAAMRTIFFWQLRDTPTTHTDQGDKIVQVNSGGTALEYTALTDLITLGTHTTGDYVASVADAGNSVITVSGSGEGAAVTLDITDGGIVSADIKDDTIDSADYAAGSIDDEHIADDTLQEPALNTSNAAGAGTDNYVLSYNHAGTNFTWVAAGGDLLADGTVPLTANWDVGNFDITLKALTGDGAITGASLTDGTASIASGAITAVTSLTFTGADASPDVAGEIQYDSTIAGMSGGGLRWFDNDSVRVLVDLETDATDDDYVVAYDADADGFYMKPDETGAGGGDPVLIDTTAITDGSGVDLTSGVGIDITLNAGVSPDTATFAFDPTELTGAKSWNDGATDASFTWTFDLSAGPTDPTLLFSDGGITTGGYHAATLLYSGAIDAIGAVDMDYGSADITDHTFTTDGTGTGEIVLPTGSIDSTEILDATVTEVDLNVTNAPGAGEDNYVLTYNHAGTNFTWAQDSTSGATAWDDISDPDNSGLTTITFDNAEATLLTGNNDAAASFLTIQNTDADHTVGQLYLLDLDYSADDGDAEADFIKFQDSGGIVMTIQQNGEIATDGGITAGGTIEGATLTEGGTGVYNTTESDAAYQPLEATLTDIADGTINENLVNTAFPWADNEISDTHSHAADSIDAITEVAAALKSGADTTFITGTAAANGQLSMFNADGDLVDASVTAAALAAIDTEAELEALLDLQDLQGAVTDAQVPDNITVDLATLATTVTITDNESTAENNAVIFASGGALEGGNMGLESDGTFFYTPSTGKVNATAFLATTYAIGDAEVSEAELEILDGCTATTTILNYIDGTTGVTGTDTTNLVYSTGPTFSGMTATGNLDFGGADLEIPQASPAVPDADGEIEIDFTDGKLVVQHGSAHAELAASTDVALTGLIKSWGGTIYAPDQVNDVITVKAINSIEFPHGVVITAVYLGISSDTGYVLTVQNFDDFDTINAANGTIDTVTYSADTTGEIIDSTPTYATIAAGQIIMISIPATDVDWIHFEIYYYEPAA